MPSEVARQGTHASGEYEVEALPEVEVEQVELEVEDVDSLDTITIDQAEHFFKGNLSYVLDDIRQHHETLAQLQKKGDHDLQDYGAMLHALTIVTAKVHTLAGYCRKMLDYRDMLDEDEQSQMWKENIPHMKKVSDEVAALDLLPVIDMVEEVVDAQHHIQSKIHHTRNVERNMDKVRRIITGLVNNKDRSIGDDDSENLALANPVRLKEVQDHMALFIARLGRISTESQHIVDNINTLQPDIPQEQTS